MATGRFRDPVEAPRGNLYTARFSPDGKLLATSGSDALVRFWDTSRWTEGRRLPSHFHHNYHLASSADGKLLFTGGQEHTLVGWDLTTGKEIQQRFGTSLGGMLWPFELSPDGKLLAADGAVWEFGTWRELYRFPFPEMPTKYRFRPEKYRYAFSPGGRFLAVCYDEAVRLCDPHTGKVLRQLDGHRGEVYNLLFTSDGKHLLSQESPTSTTTVADPALRIWDVATGREVRRLLDHRTYLLRLALSPDGRTIALVRGPETADGKVVATNATTDDFARQPPHILLWEAATDRPRLRFTGHRNAVSSLVFSPDGKRLVSTSSDALVWDVLAPGGTTPAPEGPLSRQELEALWKELGNADAARPGLPGGLRAGRQTRAGGAPRRPAATPRGGGRPCRHRPSPG
jgi:WD40 repeat protein